MNPSEIEVTTRDGVSLAASLFRNPDGSHLVIIGSGTGILRQFYFSFARFLRSQGFSVLVFDYRGIGGSRPSMLRGFDAKMQDWGRLDLEAVFAFGLSQPWAEKVSFLGHSVSGQLLGLASSAPQLSRVVFVASQEGYWKLWPMHQRWVFLPLFGPFLWVSARILGYIPARIVGLGEDLPSGVAIEWATWCRTKDYLFAFLDSMQPYCFSTLQQPILSISFSDDFFAPMKAVEALLARYPAAAIRSLHYQPNDFGRASIGHFSFFKSPGKSDSWEKLVNFLYDSSGQC
ncbi:MAG: alpha/beta hydrolase [Bdellovibrionales bacterium]|nr:alpha/beta hydrolase [Bdellovibrionales bacterium]